MPTHSRVIRGTLEEVFAVLSDYQSYPAWTPDVVASAVLAREGDIVVAEFLSPFLTEKKYVLELLHARPKSIVYNQVDQFGSRGVQGAWHLEGAADGDGTSVTGTLGLRSEASKSFRNRRRAGLILQRRLDSLEELFPRGAVDRADQPSRLEAATFQGEPLLDVVARGEPATVCWLGAKYLLTKIDR
jgi:ribosome-associated toxin RatA of RatAB toxin-antitoxin module